MSGPSLIPLPYCFQCSAVRAEGFWFKNDGSIAKTIQKLNTCAQCHLARYCNQECQTKHRNVHKVGCVASEKVIADTEVDKIVRNVCTAQTGKTVLYLDSQKKVLRTEEFPSKEVDLSIDVNIENRMVGSYTYLLCSAAFFDWESKLNAILHSNNFQAPMDLVNLGKEMVDKDLYEEAFSMIAEKIPQQYRFLKDIFFSQAVKLMQAKNVDIERIVSCAILLNKERNDVEGLIEPTIEKEMSKGLQARIDAAIKLNNEERDAPIVDLALEIIDLGLYKQASGLICDWVFSHASKITFFRSAAEKMISGGIQHNKLMKLANIIHLNNNEILNEIVSVYAVHNHIEFARQLAEKSDKPDYYLKLISSALENEEKMEETRMDLDRTFF